MSGDRVDIAEQRGLMAAAEAGDERAFRALVGPYRRALQVHCYRMIGSAHDAEDMVQETLLRAWRRLERFDRRSSLMTWLFRIATNACLDELERRPRRPEPVQPFPDALVEEASPMVCDPAARYALREGMELALLTAIQQLPGRQRAVLILRDVLGWTAPEVAELLDSTVSAMNSALQRARATIELHLPESLPRAAEATERQLLRRYVEAWERDDVEGLVALLRADAVLRMPPRDALHGARTLVRFFREHATDGDLRQMRLLPTRANGRPAVAIYKRADAATLAPHGVMLLEVVDEAIATLEAFIDPTLLPSFRLPVDRMTAPLP